MDEAAKILRRRMELNMNGIVQELKNSIEQSGLVGRLTPAHIIACMCTALVCGLIVYLIYKFYYRGAVYSEGFNILNVITCMTTCFIIMTISTNLILSLGMVGALSIVRFRAAIKDPLDIGFLFLSIAAGLTSGAGLYPLALIGTISVAVVYILLTIFGNGKKHFLLVIKHNDTVKEEVLNALNMFHAKLKSAVSSGMTTELTVTIKVKGMDTAMLDTVKKIEGVNSVVLMEYVGD